MRNLLVRAWAAVAAGSATCLAAAWVGLPTAAALALTGAYVVAAAVVAVELFYQESEE